MKTLLRALLATAVLFVASTASAQSFPVTAKVLWDLSTNAAEAVTSYIVQIDTAPGQTIQAASCDQATHTCTAVITVPDSNTHTASVVAVNQWGSSAPTAVTFRVLFPAAAANVRITK
jgi:hypothetical protein